VNVYAELSGADLAVVVVTGCSIVAVVAVLYALQRILTTVRQVRATLDEVNDQALPLLEQLAVTLDEAKRLLGKRLGFDLEFFYDSGLTPQDAATAIALQVADEAEAPGQEGLPL